MADDRERLLPRTRGDLEVEQRLGQLASQGGGERNIHTLLSGEGMSPGAIGGRHLGGRDRIDDE